MYYIEVAIPVAIDRIFTYRASEPIGAGCRVEVPFGERNRRVVGVVTGPGLEVSLGGIEAKDVLEKLDAEPAYSPVLLELARWMSGYYLCPLGEVLKSMLPAGQSKRRGSRVRLTPQGIEIWQDKKHNQYESIRFIWKRSSEIDLKLWKKRNLELATVGHGPFSLKKLEKEGLVEKVSNQKTHTRNWNKSISGEAQEVLVQDARKLTEHQKQVFDSLLSGLRGLSERKPFLLHGVTGAGKTEIYLHSIAALLDLDPASQVLVLVPEIALTPQMTQVFTARFPDLVAVVHSAMSPADRWEQLSRIRAGRSKILIGPRSAVFAPFARLGLIVVDEEHDPSYKQASGLTYNGRDVAVMRAMLEKAVVILGSATPSMESFANAESGKYAYLALTERPMGRAMPTIELLDSARSSSYATKLSNQRGLPPVLDLPVDPRILEALKQNLSNKMQSMVIVNRRGFAYYLFSLSERKAVTCPKCSISLTVHKKSSLLRCHYCDFSQTVERSLKGSDPSNFVIVGYGSEQMELFLNQALPGAKIQRVDSDTVNQKDLLPKVLNDFRSGKIDILVGTQMLAKGHDFAKVSLICILEIDQTLNLPDFRAAERAFQLMVQAAGRAGRDLWPGRVLVQTQRPDHPILVAGVTQDYHRFWIEQAGFRQAHLYPPYARMIMFECTSSRLELLVSWVADLERWIRAQLVRFPDQFGQLQILGPSIPPIEMIRGRFRRTLLLVSQDRKALWGFARSLKQSFQTLPKDLAVRVDVDPQSLM